MKLVNPDVVEIVESDPLKKIELAARTCYKSESKISEDSAAKMFDNLVKRHHYAMLEHATFAFIVTDLDLYVKLSKLNFIQHSRVRINDKLRFMISGNLRALNDTGIMEVGAALYKINPKLSYYFNDSNVFKHYVANNQMELNGGKLIYVLNLTDIGDITEEEKFKHMYRTLRFTCDRGVTHEIVRHRLCSFAQESTRYVNYNNHELTYIIPADYDSWSKELRDIFLGSLELSSNAYLNMIKKGASPQQARAVLPTEIKSEIVVTANTTEWHHFINLRSNECTGPVHPNMKVVADKAKAILYNI